MDLIEELYSILNTLTPALHHWCAAILGEFEIVSDASREHAGLRAAAHLLRSAHGSFYLKTHQDAAHWHSETHAYEHWATAFGSFAPRLVGVREEAPRALLISALPGRVIENAALSPAEALAAWRSAGRVLAGLHALPAGPFFGPCKRDGSPATALRTDAVGTDAVEYITRELEDWLARGLRISCLTNTEQSFVRDASALIPAFTGEPPVACHRDYCPPNWLVTQTERGWAFSGVIDFEFSRWDVRAADFTRYPEFDWIARPALADAFFEGYGRVFTPAEEQQRLFCHLLYALGALVWGMENEYFVYAAEGRAALAHLMKLL